MCVLTFFSKNEFFSTARHYSAVCNLIPEVHCRQNVTLFIQMVDKRDLVKENKGLKKSA